MVDQAWRWFPDTYAQKMSKGAWQPYRHLAHILDQIYPKIIEGNGRFIINLPPSFGKSETISKWLPAWYLDNFPQKKVILASYADALASTFGRWVRNFFETEENTIAKLTQDSSAATRFDTTLGGSMRTAGIGGVLTGTRGDLMLIDDAIKNWEQARSETYRQMIKDWFQTVFMTRLEPKATVIILMTRWHHDDLAGWLLSTQPNTWTHIKLKALADENDPLGRLPNESLCPERFSTEQLLKIKEEMPRQFWEALYQQEPSIEEGQLFKREWWKFYDQSPAHPIKLVQFWDTAQKPGLTNDYSVCATWGKFQHGYYLLDLFRKKLEAPDLEVAIVAQFNKWKPHQVQIEDKSSGSSMIQYLRRNTTIPVIAYDPKQKDKELRAIRATSLIQSGKVFLPKHAPWLSDFLAEHDQFPNGLHDDIVDTTSQMAEHFSSLETYQPRITFL
jgi:predicted phage terminase large subunit-like protein